MKKIILITLLFGTSLFAQTYQQDCLITDDGDVLQMSLHFDNSKVIYKATAFEEENCQKPYLIFEREYFILEKTSNALQTEHLSASYTSLTDEVTEVMNMLNYCSIDHWESSVKTDVTGAYCDPFQQAHKNEKVHFDWLDQGDVIYFNRDSLPYKKL